MNAVEIEDAVSTLADAPFDAAAFPFDFLQAFGTNDAALRKLKSGEANKSDLPGGVLQKNKNNIHLKTCPPGQVGATLDELRQSPATAKFKARFVLATDGQTIQAERADDGEPLACDFKELPDRFTFFLSLAGISTVKRIDENAFDIRATGRLNKLYVELLRHNPDWDTDARRQDLNHFFARLIFCFFAEDTNIFVGGRLFTDTVDQMTERNGSNVHEVLGELFRAMDTKPADRAGANIRPYANSFPYVNGNLFAGNTDTPRFSQAARTYLLFVGNLDWTKINPDIFGSMIQAVADDEERGALGMHYTSVPNILKVLNPLFLDDLRQKLADAGDGRTPGSARKLLNLRNRLARIRVFDPACGSGNFLVIAYKEMRGIEAELNRRRGEAELKSAIPVSNFRGIELRHFPAEIARLAMIIAEYQCDVLYRGERLARMEFLPLDAANWITCGNALRLDWLTVCPPTGTGVKLHSDGLFKEELEQVEIDFENEGGETYICGNPPYQGSTWQSKEQKAELQAIFDGRTNTWKSLDYVAGWFMKAADYGSRTRSAAAFVATNSICQGQQVSTLWPLIFQTQHKIAFAYTSFNWKNLASNNAGVTVVIVGISNHPQPDRHIFSVDTGNLLIDKESAYINGYLVGGANIFVTATDDVLSGMPVMYNGSKAVDGGHLLLQSCDVEALNLSSEQRSKLIKRFVGSHEAINGIIRYCIWIPEELKEYALTIPSIASRVKAVETERLASSKQLTRDTASRPFAFQQVRQRGDEVLIVIPRVSSESREYLPTALLPSGTIISDKCFGLYDADLSNVALISSRLNRIWIGTVCSRLRTDPSYSNTLGWNTFPVPTLTDQHKADLTRCAEDILLAREAHFPATIADLYDPEAMDTKYPDLRAAHNRNDETLERIYIGRRFRNDTERLEKLFELYTRMTAGRGKASPTKQAAARRRKAADL